MRTPGFLLRVLRCVLRIVQGHGELFDLLVLCGKLGVQALDLLLQVVDALLVDADQRLDIDMGLGALLVIVYLRFCFDILRKVIRQHRCTLSIDNQRAARTISLGMSRLPKPQFLYGTAYGRLTTSSGISDLFDGWHGSPTLLLDTVMTASRNPILPGIIS